MKLERTTASSDLQLVIDSLVPSLYSCLKVSIDSSKRQGLESLHLPKTFILKSLYCGNSPGSDFDFKVLYGEM